MLFRAVNGKCAFDFDSVTLPRVEALGILKQEGFRAIETDVVAIARERVGKAAYRRGAHLFDAPDVFDCSSFTKWVYGLCGVWLPRRPVQQRECGVRVPLYQVGAGDLVFTKGARNLYIDDPNEEVGHVGIATTVGTVIAAHSPDVGVVEIPLERFVRDRERFRGVRRVMPKCNVVILETPSRREIETSDDIKWVILRTLPKVAR